MQKETPLRKLLHGLESDAGLNSLLLYSPSQMKTNNLINLDLEKVKKDFNNKSVNLIDFIEILFSQLFNSSNSR